MANIKTKPRLEPTKGKRIWFFDESLNPKQTAYNPGFFITKHLWVIGNCFPTRKACGEAIKVMKLLLLMKPHKDKVKDIKMKQAIAKLLNEQGYSLRQIMKLLKYRSPRSVFVLLNKKTKEEN